MCARLGRSARRACDDGGERDVLERRSLVEQVEELEHEADVPAADMGQLGLVLAGERLAGEDDLAVARRLEPGDEVQQRRLPAPGRARDRDELAPRTARSSPRNARTGAPSDSNVLRRPTVFNTSGAAATNRL